MSGSSRVATALAASRRTVVKRPMAKPATSTASTTVPIAIRSRPGVVAALARSRRMRGRVAGSQGKLISVTTTSSPRTNPLPPGCPWEERQGVKIHTSRGVRSEPWGSLVGAALESTLATMLYHPDLAAALAQARAAALHDAAAAHGGTTLAETRRPVRRAAEREPDSARRLPASVRPARHDRAARRPRSPGAGASAGARPQRPRCGGTSPTPPAPSVCPAPSPDATSGCARRGAR